MLQKNYMATNENEWKQRLFNTNNTALIRLKWSRFIKRKSPNPDK